MLKLQIPKKRGKLEILGCTMSSSFSKLKNPNPQKLNRQWDSNYIYKWEGILNLATYYSEEPSENQPINCALKIRAKKHKLKQKGELNKAKKPLWFILFGTIYMCEIAFCKPKLPQALSASLYEWYQEVQCKNSYKNIGIAALRPLFLVWWACRKATGGATANQWRLYKQTFWKDAIRSESRKSPYLQIQAGEGQPTELQGWAPV